MTITKIRDSRSRLYRGLTVLHATKDGGPVLREQSSWRTINGLMLSIDRGTWCWTFRIRP